MVAFMKEIAIVVKNDPNAMRLCESLEGWLVDRGVRVLTRTNWGSEVVNAHCETAPSGLGAVIVLGGDGTFLSAVRWIGKQDVPILGVKFGELGFLAEISEETIFQATECLLNGQFRTRLRMRLDVSIYRVDAEDVHQTVLNDVVVTKGALARLASIRTSIDGKYLTTYKADGLIVSTPTGSTAYSLAAGGPIVHPDVPGIILTPICPFTLTIRPLIVSDSVSVEIALEKRARDVMVTFDGQAGLELLENDRLAIRKSEHPVRMIVVPGQDYFDLVKTKLRWSGGRQQAIPA